MDTGPRRATPVPSGASAADDPSSAGPVALTGWLAVEHKDTDRNAADPQGRKP